MRFLITVLCILAVGLGLIYHYGGIKLGIATITPTRMWNAQGEVKYSYLNGSNVNGIVVSGDCTAQSGNVIMRLTDPDGLQVGGQQCPKGTWTISMANKAKLGQYHLTIEYRNFTGALNLTVTR